MTYDEATNKLASVKETLATKREELKAFKTEHNLKGDAEPTQVKLKQKLSGIKKAIEAGMAEKETLVELVKELKPKKEREPKYDYPLVDDGKGKKREMDDREKKKYRAKMRTEAKGGKKESKKKVVEKKPATAPAAIKKVKKIVKKH